MGRKGYFVIFLNQFTPAMLPDTSTQMRTKQNKKAKEWKRREMIYSWKNAIAYVDSHLTAFK